MEAVVGVVWTEQEWTLAVIASIVAIISSTRTPTPTTMSQPAASSDWLVLKLFDCSGQVLSIVVSNEFDNGKRQVVQHLEFYFTSNKMLRIGTNMLFIALNAGKSIFFERKWLITLL